MGVYRTFVRIVRSLKADIASFERDVKIHEAEEHGAEVFLPVDSRQISIRMGQIRFEMALVDHRRDLLKKLFTSKEVKFAPEDMEVIRIASEQIEALRKTMAQYKAKDRDNEMKVSFSVEELELLHRYFPDEK